MYDASNGTFVGPSNGVDGGNYDVYGADRTIPRSMTAFTAIAWYNSIEILSIIFFIFKRYSGLYFWSLLITTLSILPYASGAWMKQNNVSHNQVLTDVLSTIGWVIMVPGQSLVLYSRLHLISQNHKLLRFTLWMIITSAIVLCVPTSILNLRQSTQNPAYTKGYKIMEKIQMTLFAAQEAFISFVYLWEVRRVLMVISDGRTRKSMWQLVAMNVFLLALDITLLTIEFFNLYMIETTFKSLVYSTKLKVEFAVLSQIVRVVQDRSEPNSLTLAISDAGGKEAEGGLRELDLERAPSRNFEVQITQRNLPPEWRLSIGNAMGEPDLLEIGRARKTRSERRSFESVDRMYPGRLGW
ncbi:hypothetical protein BS50DRAFT_212372 [Corynespora cassiicola Philippines]|uniref:DUF7703 domain-containing protein n=1 Tax=Corynespora cassiicola Philippines TaxID=1448308 RepID=A0A2T2N4R2_CORCC|nr:hypothetical protein BS50DRAFT_212372 [Corynespora cassiicola Philippines]